MIDAILMNKIAVFSRKTELSHCRKINLIFGNNGTGKTLLSNYLQDPAQPEYADCSIRWDDGRPLPVYVFNQKFCDRNFRETDIPGIFTLGSENAELEKSADEIGNRIDEANQELRHLRNEYEIIDQQKQAQRDICIDALWERVKTYKNLLGDYFTKPVSKIQCFVKVKNEISQAPSGTPELYDLKRMADVLNSQTEEEYPVYPHLDGSQLISIEKDPIWDEAPQEGEPGKKDEKYTDWVRQGLRYMDQQKVCPFCEQRILSGDFDNKITRLLSGDHGQKPELRGRLLSQYESHAKRLLAYAERIMRQNRDEGEAFLDTGRFADTITNLRNLIHANMLFMQRKRDSSAGDIQIQSCYQLITALNQLIDGSNFHASRANAMLNDLRNSKSQLKTDSWRSFCKASEQDISNYNTATADIEKNLETLQIQIDRTESAVRMLTADKEAVLRNTVNIRESVDRINDELVSLGTGNFYLRLSEDGRHYNILRDNGENAAETLSEGEKTLIMLLYFLQLVEGASSNETLRSERVVVIDDPVANLDDTSLNAVLDRVGALISRILDGDRYIRQLFVLSHRKECTKKLRSTDPRLETGRDLALWILRKKEGITQAHEFKL